MRSIRRQQPRAPIASHWQRTLRHGLWYVPLVHLGLPLLVGWPRGPRTRLPRWARFAGRGMSVAGGGLTAWAVWTMVRHGDGTPAPHDPPRRLICAGPYCHVRNPMEFGNWLALTGRALAAGCPRLAIASLSFGIGTHVWVVLIEEPYLQRHFGSAYRAYCERVPRWRWRIATGAA